MRFLLERCTSRANKLTRSCVLLALSALTLLAVQKPLLPRAGKRHGSLPHHDGVHPIHRLLPGALSSRCFRSGETSELGKQE